MRVPDEPRFTQGAKGGGHSSDDGFSMLGIAERIVHDMKPGVMYLVGSGTTTRAIMEKLGLPNTLLGIDVVKDRQLVAADCTERRLLELLDGQPAEVILTPVGGQGYILGRGNQQLSPDVLRKVGPDHVTVIATLAKVGSLPSHQIRVDTGDVEVDEMLRGPHRVLSGAAEVTILEGGLDAGRQIVHIGNSSGRIAVATSNETVAAPELVGHSELKQNAMGTTGVVFLVLAGITPLGAFTGYASAGHGLRQRRRVPRNPPDGSDHTVLLCRWLRR